MAVTSTKPGAHPEHATIVGDRRELLDELLDKWGLMLLGALCHAPRRFSELKRELDGVTQKSLTQALRRLERNGIVERRVLARKPLAVEYRITALGYSLEGPFAVLRDWTSEHLAEVVQNRAAYDAAVQGSDPEAAETPAPSARVTSASI